MTPVGAKLNMQPGIALSAQKAEVKGNKLSTRSAAPASAAASGGSGVKQSAAARMYGATPATTFRSQTPALRPFNINKATIDHSGTRAMLNSDNGRTLAQMNAMKREMAAMGQMRSCQHQDGNKFQDVAMTATALMGMLNKIAPNGVGGGSKAGGVKTGGSDKSSKTPTNDVADNSAIKGMKGAKDSVSLRAAIDTAKADKTKMESDLQTITSGLDTKKAAAEEAKTALDGIKEEVQDQKAVVKDKETAVSGAKTNLDQATGNLANAKGVLSIAENALGEASGDVKKATSDLSSARQELSNTPQTNPDGSVNPNYAIVKAKVATCETNKQAADAAYLKANQGKENALQNYNSRSEAKDKAEEDVKTKTEALNTAQKELETANAKLTELNKKQAAAENAIDSYEKDLKQQEKLTKDIKNYDDEIKEQGERLTELEKKDTEDLGKTDGKINTLLNKIDVRADKIDTNDGRNTLREKIAAKKNDKSVKEFDSLQQERDAIQQRIDVRNLLGNVPTQRTEDGQSMRQGRGTDGKTIYMIGSKVVDETTFNAKAKAATKTAPDAINDSAVAPQFAQSSISPIKPKSLV